ncbi:MAG: carbon-nitrogen hydrolase [Phycisphaerales bacterium]|nr:carbon-nitrogen hydrolase [Phycisphaerales bacterium]
MTSTQSSPRTLTVGLLQHACPVTATKEEVLANVAKLARAAKAQGAELIVTQELFVGSYFCQAEDAARMDLAEAIPDGPTCQYMAKLAAELDVEITASLYERRQAGLYHNTSVYFSRKGAILGRYRKMHIPDDPRFSEKYYFTPGDLGWQVVQGTKAMCGMLVCWDQWYPEAARLTALKGAELICYPTAIGWYHGETPRDAKAQREAWITMHKAHAIANGCFVIAVNRIGVEADLRFWGTSLVCDPAGQIIAEGSIDQEEVIVCTLELNAIEEIRRGWPFLRDRRIDAYQGLSQRFSDEPHA